MWVSTRRQAVRMAVAGLLALFCLAASGSNRALQSPTAYRLAANCDDDGGALRALQSIHASVAAAIERSRSGDLAQQWRVHSICKRGGWAYAFVKGYYPGTDLPVPAPSDIALIQWTAEGWKTSLPEEVGGYTARLAEAPATLIPDSLKSVLRQQPSAAAARSYSNYALPYPAGQSAYTLRHWYPALDFSIGGPGGGDVIRNAKAGTAVFVKRSSSRACGDPPPDWTCWQWANAIVIQSAPDEFAWYLHFAPHTIPEWIQEGVYVPDGADLGQEGDTGWASVAHLHFMVSSTFGCCDGEGDGRFPHWPYVTTYPVNFVEFSWSQLPWLALSQNGAGLPAAPPPEPDPAGDPVAAPPEPAPAASVCPNPYTVQTGEWLNRIASQCGVTLGELMAANPGVSPNLIYAGQFLSMPSGQAASAPPPTPVPVGEVPEDGEAPAAGAADSLCRGTHTVAAGENLFRIAYYCGLTTDQLAAANRIGYPYTIYPGQVLAFP